MEADHETLSLERSVKQDLEALKQKNLQFRFEAVENVMAPLIHQVKNKPAIAASTNNAGYRYC